MRISIVVVLLAATLLPGCSSLFLRRPPAPDCSRSYALPVVDAVAGAAGIGLAVAENVRGAAGPAIVVADLVGLVGVGYEVSAAIGSHRVRRCRAEQPALALSR